MSGQDGRSFRVETNCVYAPSKSSDINASNACWRRLAELILVTFFGAGVFFAGGFALVGTAAEARVLGAGSGETAGVVAGLDGAGGWAAAALLCDGAGAGAGLVVGAAAAGASCAVSMA